MPYFETPDGTRLSYVDWEPDRGMDAGGDTIVFIHGLALGSDMWEYQMLDLSEAGVRCVAYDHRGHGLSDRPGRGYDFDTLAEDLAGLLAHLDIHGATLVGFSLGGAVIARYLAHHGPEGRAAKAVFLCATTPFLLKGPDNPDGVDRSLIYDQFREGLRRDRPALYAAIAPTFFGMGLPGVQLSKEATEWAIHLGDQACPKATWDLYRAANEDDLRADVGAVAISALVIHGDSDAFAPVEATGRRTAESIPGARLTVYENAAHGLFLTHQERLRDDLLAFARG